MCRQYPLLGRARERWSAREQLVRDGTDGIDVGPMVDVRVSCGLLRSHVRWRAECNSRGRQLLTARCLAHCLRYAEVGDQSVTPGEHHIVWLYVPMNHFALVSVCQSINHISKDADSLSDG